MHPFFLVDAFSDRPFGGNPAGVVLLDAPLSDPAGAAWAQQIAAEVRASETAFVAPEGGTWRLRWWTPAAEVDLCGHATLAAAHVLATQGLTDAGRTGGGPASDGPTAEADVLRFQTRSGELRAWQAEGGRLTLALPAWPVAAHDPPSITMPALLGGIDGRYVGRTTVAQANDLIEVADLAALDQVRVDRAAVARLGSQGLIVAAPADRATDGVDVGMRYFAPVLGVEEDPVTGSAAATVAPWWAQRTGTDDVVIEQRSERRGTLHCTVHDAEVAIAGDAVTVVSGRIVGQG